ncbi:MAG: hypothetical protein JST67_00060 [Bacteroidetes bacterium]|nr:hypothetical protein [Bacteroidota bacterium]
MIHKVTDSIMYVMIGGGGIATMLSTADLLLRVGIGITTFTVLIVRLKKETKK